MKSVFSSSNSSASCLALFTDLWYACKLFCQGKRKADVKCGPKTLEEKQHEKNLLERSTYHEALQGAVDAMQTVPGDGGRVETCQLVPQGREGAVDPLKIFQKEQHTAVAH